MQTNLTEWPPYKNAINQLQKLGLIKYGAEISWQLLEELIDMGDRESWRFKSQFIILTAQLKNMGFMLSQKGLNGTGVRILKREEMADLVNRREFYKAHDTLRNSQMLSEVPRDDMAESDIKKLDHWEHKTAILGATAIAILRRRKLPPADMAVKSIRQLAALE